MASFSQKVKNELCELLVEDGFAAQAEVSLDTVLMFSGSLRGNTLRIGTALRELAALLRDRIQTVSGQPSNVRRSRSMWHLTVNAPSLVRAIQRHLLDNYGFTYEHGFVGGKFADIGAEDVAGEGGESVFAEFTDAVAETSSVALDDIVLTVDNLAAELAAEGISRASLFRRAVLRGLFLSVGSINIPDSGYHLGFMLRGIGRLSAVLSIFRLEGLQPLESRHGGSTRLYFKEADQIVNFLAMTGAWRAVLDLENLRVERDLRNEVNRAVNFDSANLRRVATAAARQLAAIEALREVDALADLDEALRETARLRLRHPDLSLVELGQLFVPPLSKSGLNHRLKRLEALAVELGLRSEY
ncbi:MAG: DNA-binding protein WhiA [Clostridiaceae bacterium]|nr:DNA-binding protein WhiA [Clostridiaceae bacterium]